MAQNKDALKAAALRQRIGEITSGYEDQLADLRAEATIIIEQLNERVRELEAQVVKEDDVLAEEADSEA